MDLIKVIFIVAITMAFCITLIMESLVDVEEKPPFPSNEASTSTTLSSKELVMPSRRLSRFLAEKKNPRAADHCHKDNQVCQLQGYYKNATCCNNKCMDLSSDKHNCGVCKNKCKFGQECCRGECVLLSLDKRHCGACNNRCPYGELCTYGMCNYP